AAIVVGQHLEVGEGDVGCPYAVEQRRELGIAAALQTALQDGIAGEDELEGHGGTLRTPCGKSKARKTKEGFWVRSRWRRIARKGGDATTAGRDRSCRPGGLHPPDGGRRNAYLPPPEDSPDRGLAAGHRAGRRPPRRHRGRCHAGGVHLGG